MSDQRIKKHTLLVVDDNVDILNYLTDLLESDYIVSTATNGEDAIAVLNKEYIQLIITDISMPVMNGLQLRKRIRADIAFGHIPIILLTVSNTLQYKIEGLECGADAYIEKSFSSKYLRAQIFNLLENRQKIKIHLANSPHSHIDSIAYNQADSHFLEELTSIVLNNIENPDLDVNYIALRLNMSRATLYSKIKGISDLSPNELINLTRLKKAAELLSKPDCRINEIYYQIGYSSQKYFSFLFQKQFGMLPSEYIHSHKLHIAR